MFGALAWLLALLGLLSFLMSLGSAVSNPAGFLGSLVVFIAWCWAGYGVGKTMFKAGNYKFIKKIK